MSKSDARTTPQHRSLADFERLYSGVLDVLRKVKDAFPSLANETLTSDEVLVRLEKIRTGFQAWATSIEAPTR